MKVCSVCGTKVAGDICAQCGCRPDELSRLKRITVACACSLLLPGVILPVWRIPKYQERAAEITEELATAQGQMLKDAQVFVEQISAENKPSKFITLADRFLKNLAEVERLVGLGATHPRVNAMGEEFNSMVREARELFLAVKSDVMALPATWSAAPILDRNRDRFGVPDFARRNYESIMDQLRAKNSEVENAKDLSAILEAAFNALQAADDELIARATVAKNARTPTYEQVSAIRSVADVFRGIGEQYSDYSVQEAVERGVEWCHRSADYYEAFGTYNEYLQNNVAPDRAAAERYRRSYLTPLSIANRAARGAIAKVGEEAAHYRKISVQNPRDIKFRPGGNDYGGSFSDEDGE